MIKYYGNITTKLQTILVKRQCWRRYILRLVAKFIDENVCKKIYGVKNEAN